MQKILIVNSFYYPDIKGGAEVSTQLLAEGLTKLYDVHVLTTGDHQNDILKENINGVHVYRLPSNNLYWPGNSISPNFLSKLSWHFINNFNPIQNRYVKLAIKEISPSLIHTQNLMGIGTFLWKIAANLNIPVVHTTRDYALMEPVSNRLVNKYLNYFNKKRSQSVNYVVGISQFILKQHLNNSFFYKSGNNDIHNVVDTPRYKKRSRQEGESLTIGCYGQMEAVKGIDILIQSVQKLPVSTVEKVIICGTGSEEKHLKQMTKGDNRFEFMGKVTIEEVYQTMALTDVTVVPSRWEEPFGRVIIESYAQGTPVIAANVGGIPEVIINKAYLFEKNSVEDLCKKIKETYELNNNEILQSIDNAFQFSDKYRSNLRDYQDIYKSLLK